MAKHEGGGIKQRKMMAMGHGPLSGGSFGVVDHAFEHDGITSEDKGLGEKAHMADHERAIGHPIERGKGMMPMQAHPDHGPHRHPGHHSGKNHHHKG